MIGPVLGTPVKPRDDEPTLIQFWNHQGRWMCKTNIPLTPEQEAKVSELFALLNAARN